MISKRFEYSYSDYDNLIESLIFDGIRICEIGPSGKPSIKSSEIKRRKLNYSIIDVETIHWINYNPEVFLTYQLNIPSGYYDIDTLLKDIKILSTNVLHGGFSYNTVSLLGNESQGRIPDEELPTEMEEPYYSNPYMQNTPNLWDFEINMQNNAFFAVNRIEEVDVISYQTHFSNSGYFFKLG